ncbi:ATP-binding protein, partial [Halorhodospira sp. 9621]|uniref:AAA family ATPase n=1 Tax=Halorhodospira sp. 9621 TaxID=2899135 RepID=UPI001EE94DC8
FGARGLLGLLLGGRSESRGGKAWTNHLLETNPVPALWVTNTPQQLDPAYLRRFAYVVEVNAPDPAARAQMMAEACRGLPVSRAWIERAAETEGLTPAEIRNATRVARLVAQGDDPSAVEVFLDEHLRRQCRLQGRQPPRRRRGTESIGYDRSYINAEPDPEATINALLGLGEGSVLLHGPPGTGKTALAEHVAREAGRSLISRPASQLLSKWVGQTEQNLARLFETAQRRGAVLLIDEADSLLRSRSSARASWEVTQTNELLVQLEAFEGIVLCATNHLEALDEAALRRFDHKLALHALRPSQRRALFMELLRVTVGDGGDALSDEEQAAVQRRLERLDSLTPGDFATVARRWRRGAPDAAGPSIEDLIVALEAEERVKPGHGKQPLGFI